MSDTTTQTRKSQDQRQPDPQFCQSDVHGECKAALDLLSKKRKGGILHLDDHSDLNNPDSPTARDILISKHPLSQCAYSNCIISSEPQDSNQVIFVPLMPTQFIQLHLEWIAQLVLLALCTSFKGASSDLCASLASVVRRIYVNPSIISLLLACRLIALDKHPSACPIGIGDTSLVTSPDTQNTLGFGFPAVMWGGKLQELRRCSCH